MDFIFILSTFIIGLTVGILTAREVYKIRISAKLGLVTQRKNQLINDYSNAVSRRQLNEMIAEVEALELVIKTLKTIK